MLFWVLSVRDAKNRENREKSEPDDTTRKIIKIINTYSVHTYFFLLVIIYYF